MKNNIKTLHNLGAKINTAPSLISWILALTLGLFAVMAQAEGFRYRFVSLDQAELPTGFLFFFLKLLTTVAGYTEKLMMNRLIDM